MQPKPTLTTAWRGRTHDVLDHGVKVSPRGMETLETPQATIVFDMNYPVLIQPSRQLNYQFMLAEAWWILAGRSDVESIAAYNRHISQFSDNGVSFAGAYGPRIATQMDYIIQTILNDQDTRQANLVIWEPNPKPSKDIPCTIAMGFNVREAEDGMLELNGFVYMRSSDIWLGLPYDSFNFTMVAATVCSHLNQHSLFSRDGTIRLGKMHLTAASSHLYSRDWDQARQVLLNDPTDVQYDALPVAFYDGSPAMPEALLDILKDTKKDDPKRWWNAR